MKNNLFTDTFRYWWIPLITGVLALAVGVLCFLFPASSLESLAIIFECCLLVAGVFNICYALSNSGHNAHWVWPFANGLIEVILAIWMWTMPIEELTLVFIYIVALWLLFICVYAISEYATLSSLRVGWGGWLIGLVLIGILLVLFCLMGPVGSGLFVWIFIGSGFLAYGISRIVLAISLYRYNRRHQ